MQISGIKNLKTSYVMEILPNKSTMNPLKQCKNDIVSFGKIDGNACLKTNTDINFSNLSERGLWIPRGRDYGIVSMPKSMKLTKVNVEGKEIEIPLRNEGTETKPCVAVIDLFSNCSGFNFNIGKRNDLAHGDVVGKFVANGLEDDLEVLAFNITDGNTRHRNSKMINQVLDDILEMNKRGTKIDAVNISFGTEVDYGNLSKTMNRKIDATNIEQFKDEILAKYKKSLICNNDILMLEKINELVKNGIEIFLAAGNQYFTLQDMSDAHVVGGLGKFGEKKYPTCDPNFPYITEYEKAEHNLKNLKSEDSKDGGVGNDYVKFENVGKVGLFSGKSLSGTSFSCPIAVNKFFKGKVENN